MTLSVLCLLFLELPSQAAKARVPDRAVLEKTTREMRDLFKAEYAKRDRASRKALAERLVADVDKAASPGDSEFVFLVEARDLAVDAVEPDLALDSIRRMAKLYDLGGAGPEFSPGKMRLAILATVRRGAKSPEEANALLGAYARVAEDALGEGDYDSAADAAKQASGVARAARNTARIQEIQDLEKEIESIRKEFGDIRRAELALSVTPDDPDANLLMGRFLCFVREQWEAGLQCLARGGDATLKALAEKELAKLEDSAGQVAIADAWYDHASKEKSAFNKERYQSRAREWYEKAATGASGLARVKIDKRLEDLSRGKLRRGGVIISQGLIGAWNLDEGRGTFIADTSPQGLSGTVVNADAAKCWLGPTAFGRPTLGLDGVDDGVKIAGERAWNTIVGSLTMAAWVYVEAAQPGYRALVCRQRGATANNHFYFGFGGARLGGFVQTTGPMLAVLEPAPFPLREWIHVAMVYDGSSLKVYRAGKEVASIPASGNFAPDTTPILIGRDDNGPGAVYMDAVSGRIARVRIYSRALTAAEIMLLATRDR